MHETPRETPPITRVYMLAITIATDELFLHVTIPGTKELQRRLNLYYLAYRLIDYRFALHVAIVFLYMHAADY